MENMTEKAKEIPENTLTVIQAEGRTIYLTRIYRVPLECKDLAPNSLLAKREGWPVLNFVFIEGDYPNDYAEKDYFMDVFPEDKISRLSLALRCHITYKNGKQTYSTDKEADEWENAGYSTDNSLWAKIYEYYLKKSKIKKQ
jgi:hypothetical protein